MSDDSSPESTATAPETSALGRGKDREGDPLAGLWHWSDHPAVRVGIVLGILAASLVLFPVLAQWMF